jgi:peptide/nickel transport system ATP-binding protein
MERVMETVLEVKNVRIGFEIEGDVKQIVYGVDFQVKNGRVLTILGESGCGKTVLGSSILKLLPYNAVVSGKIYFNSQEILAMPESVFHGLRGKGIAVAMQGGESGLDPVVKIGKQAAEALMYHEGLSYSKALSRVEEIFVSLGLTNSHEILDHYPYELSGGMNQRVLLGMTAVLQPQFLLLDEPTKGLDAASKADTIVALTKLTAGTQSAILLITHDVELARLLSRELMIMYAGEIIEILSPDALDNPEHPYTRGLMASAPEGGFVPIPGYAPDSRNMPRGCHFAPRCKSALAECAVERPPLIPRGTGMVRCFSPLG